MSGIKITPGHESLVEGGHLPDEPSKNTASVSLTTNILIGRDLDVVRRSLSLPRILWWHKIP